MTHRQRKLVRGWIIAGALVVVVFIFNDFIERNIWWLGIISGFCAAIALKGRAPIEIVYENWGERSAFEDVAEEAPWLKVWAFFWSIVFASVALYAVTHSIDLASLGLFRVIFIPIIILLAPFVIMIELD